MLRFFEVDMHCPCCQKPVTDPNKICWGCNSWVFCHSPCRVRFCANHQLAFMEKHFAVCPSRIAYLRLPGQKVEDVFERPFSTSNCDRCKNDFNSDFMVYWLVEISDRPIPEGRRGEVGAVGTKFCRTCAHFVKQDLMALLGCDLHLTV